MPHFREYKKTFWTRKQGSLKSIFSFMKWSKKTKRQE